MRYVLCALTTVLLSTTPLRAADNLVATTVLGIRPERVLRAVFRTTGSFPFPSSPTVRMSPTSPANGGYSAGTGGIEFRGRLQMIFMTVGLISMSLQRSV